jgi:hypothetical protein
MYCCSSVLLAFPFHLHFSFVPIFVYFGFRFAFHWLESNRSYRFSMRTQMESKFESKSNENWNETEMQMERERWKNAGTTVVTVRPNSWQLYKKSDLRIVLCGVVFNLFSNYFYVASRFMNNKFCFDDDYVCSDVNRISKYS